MTRHARPWGDYLLRVVACFLLFVTGFGLLSTSTFALRMRNDIQPFVSGLNGPQGISLVLALALSFLPLLAGRRFLGMYLLSSFIMAGIGAYWWSGIAWDELITDSHFPATHPPGVMDFALVASPVFLAASYVAISRVSVVRADHKNRGVDPDEALRAAAATFLAGAVALVATTVMSLTFWLALADGWFLVDHPLRGVPAVLTAGGLVVAAWIFSGVGLGEPSSKRRSGSGLSAEPHTSTRPSPSTVGPP